MRVRRGWPASRPLVTKIAVVAVFSALSMGIAGCTQGLVRSGETGTREPVVVTSPSGTDVCTGIAVAVDFGVLDVPRIETCVSAGEITLAPEILDRAGIALVGTADYGDAIVCRVNGLPSPTEPVFVDGYEPHTETCSTMPPEYAYWALWVKQGASDWSYAMVGVGELRLSPGESIGLVYTTGLTTPTPN